MKEFCILLYFFQVSGFPKGTKDIRKRKKGSIHFKWLSNGTKSLSTSMDFC